MLWAKLFEHLKLVPRMKGFVQEGLVLSDSTLKNKSTWHQGGVSGTGVRPRSALALVPWNNFGFLQAAASPERSTSKSFIKLVQRSHKSAPSGLGRHRMCKRSVEKVWFLSSFFLQTPPRWCFFPHLTWPPNFSTLKHVSEAGAWRWQHGQQVSQGVLSAFLLPSCLSLCHPADGAKAKLHLQSGSAAGDELYARSYWR